MRTLAAFKGADGSLGYRAGVVYLLYITDEETPKIEWPYICPYSSWDALKENWILLPEGI